MMKAKDCSVATALVINGYLRANVEHGEIVTTDKVALAECLNAIRQEVADWAENLEVPKGLDDCALEPESMAISATVAGGGLLNRTPYNLVSVAIAGLREAVDLAGLAAVMADFQKRSGLTASVHINDLHASTHPLARANAASWLKPNGGPVKPGRGKASPLMQAESLGATAGFAPRPEDPTNSLIEAADMLAAEIDAATARPVAKTEAWHVLIENLRGRGVNVEECCTPPQNW